MAITTIEELNSALNNPNEFKRLIENNIDLIHAAERFPVHAETLIQVVLNDPNEFKRLIENNINLRNIAVNFPVHAETLIQVVLNDPNEFKRLIKSNFDLRETAKRFPGHAEIFTQPTVEQALKAMMLQSKAAQFYTAGAATGALASGTPPLPPEIGH